MLTIARVNTSAAVILDKLLVSLRPQLVLFIRLASKHIVDFITLIVKVELCIGIFDYLTQVIKRECATDKIASAPQNEDSSFLVELSSVWIVCVLPYYRTRALA